MKLRADLLIEHAAELITCAEGSSDLIGRIYDGAVAVAGKHIIAVGQTAQVRQQVDTSHAKVINASGKVVAPGFVDCHTHLVFGGSRVKEYAARMTHTAAETAAMGIPCGIPSTVLMTRAESEPMLAASALDRLGHMLRSGSTTVEIKSGYGLSLGEELKMLRVNKLLQEQQPIDIVSTFLGAHDFPPDMPRDDYVGNIINQQLPAIADQGIATFCDVYCDTGYYTVEESRRILGAGLDLGSEAQDTYRGLFKRRRLGTGGGNEDDLRRPFKLLQSVPNEKAGGSRGGGSHHARPGFCGRTLAPVRCPGNARSRHDACAGNRPLSRLLDRVPTFCHGPCVQIIWNVAARGDGRHDTRRRQGPGTRWRPGKPGGGKTRRYTDMGHTDVRGRHLSAR